MNRSLLLLTLLLLAVSCSNNEEEWIQLFNGKDLNDWDIKIKGHPLNENYNNTFVVEDGLLKVKYDEYDNFNGEFGHIFYKKPFSEYKLRVEYRFVGDQVKGGPSWAYRNNGAMLHCQSAASMELNQDFPVSVEAQLLGGDGYAERPTGNVCTPGTHIVMNNKLITQHCINSTSKTYHGDVWVTAEFVVLADRAIYHIIEGDTVLYYTKPQVGGNNKPAGYPVPDGTLLKEGYISFQAESAPTEFRKIELLDLSKNKKYTKQ